MKRAALCGLFVAGGYAFVFRDIRGRHKSKVRFMMQRTPISLFGEKSDPKIVDEVAARRPWRI